MLDINLIRENPELVRQALGSRQMDSAVVDEALQLDEERRSLLIRVEALKAERNTVSREIGKEKDKDLRQARIEAMRQVSDEISALDDQLRQVEVALFAFSSALAIRAASA